MVEPLPQGPAPKSPAESERLRRIGLRIAGVITLAAIAAGWFAPSINTVNQAQFVSPILLPVYGAVCGLGFAAPLACLWVNLWGPRAHPRALFRFGAQRMLVAAIIAGLSPVILGFSIPFSVIWLQAAVVFGWLAQPLAPSVTALLFLLPITLAYPLVVAVIRNVTSHFIRVAVFVGLYFAQYALLAVLGINSHAI